MHVNCNLLCGGMVRAGSLAVVRRKWRYTHVGASTALADPFRAHTDAELRGALERVQLWAFVEVRGCGIGVLR